MPKTAIYTGILLILLGIIGYVIGSMNDRGSITALIPAIFGIILFALGLVAQSKESLRKHMMHAAAAVALLGFLAVAGRLIPNLGGLTMSAAVVSQIAMAVICLIFVILAVKSFIDARRSGTV